MRLVWLSSLALLGCGVGFEGSASSAADGAGGSAAHTSSQGGSTSTTSSSDNSTTAGGGGAGGSTTVTTTTTDGAGGGGGDWWDPSWSQRVKLTFDNAASGEHLVDFPVLVEIEDAGIVAACQNDGADVRFVDDGMLLAHEIELWPYVWVEVPQIDAGSMSDHIWLYFDNPSAVQAQNAPAVWSSGYRGVWHLGEAAGDHADSTGNNNTGQRQNNTVVSGAIGNAQLFDGSADRIVVAGQSFQIGGSQITLQARANANASIAEDGHVIGAGSDAAFWKLWFDAADGWAGSLRIDGARRDVRNANGGLSQWVTLTLLYDGSNVRLYVDGTNLIDTHAVSGTLDPIDTAFHIGNNPTNPSSNRDFGGMIDEVRIADVARSTSWIAAQHKSLTGALISFGPIESN